MLLLCKVSFFKIPCQLSMGESSIGVPFLDIEIDIPLDLQMDLYSKDVYWNPWSLWMIRSCTSFLFAIASFNVSITNWLLLNFDILYATTFLSYKSNIVDKYNRLSLNIKYVISVVHFWFGFSALKFLFNILGWIFSSILL